MSQETGVVFDIQRCSLHDGPGIRTTVFLKGCPLSCEWCHNPESQSFKPQLAYFKDKCIGCQLCERICEQSVHQFVHKSHIVNYEQCNACGKCVDICPSKALKIYGEKVTVEEIMQIVLMDQVYYNQTEGGLTISGGEPLSQLGFLKELLVAAKSAGIHTCIETSGFAPKESFMEIMPYIDYILFDYKVTGEENHKKYTGVGQKLILDNLDLLYNNYKKIFLRCPIIPNVNDHMEHKEAIRVLTEKYPRLEGVELLTYHDLWKSKADAIGR